MKRSDTILQFLNWWISNLTGAEYAVEREYKFAGDLAGQELLHLFQRVDVCLAVEQQLHLLL
jgi:hypothetical protein